MTEAMPFLQKYDITFLRPPTIRLRGLSQVKSNALPKSAPRRHAPHPPKTCHYEERSDVAIRPPPCAAPSKKPVIANRCAHWCGNPYSPRMAPFCHASVGVGLRTTRPTPAAPLAVWG